MVLPVCRCGGWRVGRCGRRGHGMAGTHQSLLWQVFGMIFTCCLYKSLKLEHY